MSTAAPQKLSHGAMTVTRYRRGAGGITEVVTIAPTPPHGFLVRYSPRIVDRGWVDWHPAFETAVAQLEGLAASEGLGVTRESHAYYVWHKGDALYRLTAVVSSPLPGGGAIDELPIRGTNAASEALREREQAEYMQDRADERAGRGEAAAQACREDNEEREAPRRAAQWEGAAEQSMVSAQRAEGLTGYPSAMYR